MLRSDGLSADESLLTGESDAVEKRDGDEVMSGSFVDRGRRPHPRHRGGRRLLRRPTHRRGQEVQGPEVRAGPGHRQDPAGRHLGHHPHRRHPLLRPAGQRGRVGPRHPHRHRGRDGGPRAAGARPAPEHGPGRRRHPARAQAGRWSSSCRPWRRWRGSRCWPPTRRAPSPPARSASRRSSRSLTGGNGADLEGALAALAAADEYPNATMKAIQRAFPTSPGWSMVGRIPFDSTHKYSAVSFDGHGAWYVGAPEILLSADHPGAAAGAAAGLRRPARAAPGRGGLHATGRHPAPRPQRRRAGAVQRRHPARRRRDHRVLPQGERAAEGDLGRQPRHRVGHRAALPRPRRRALHRRPPAAHRSRPSWPRPPRTTPSSAG